MSLAMKHGPDDEEQVSIQKIQEAVNGDPEVGEALSQLVHFLEYAWTPSDEDRAWSDFHDRIKYIITRAKSAAARAQEDPDLQEHG